MANYYYKTHDLLYAPAEIAIGKFTIENGLQKYYHSFINPGVVISGWAADANDYSKSHHRIPPPGMPNEMGERDYDKVYTGILDILGIDKSKTFEQDDINRPCVYVRKEDIQMIESILDQLSADFQWRKKFNVFDLELLFNELKSTIEIDPDAPNKRYPMSVTSYFIEADPFFLAPDISCHFHEENDVPNHCALSFIRRWFYLFANHLAEKRGVKLIRGKHLPTNYIEVKSIKDDPWDDDGDDGRIVKPSENGECSSNVNGIGKRKINDDSSSESDDDD